MGVVLGLDICQGGSSKDEELFPQSWEETVSRSRLSQLFPVLQDFFFKLNTYRCIYACTYHLTKQGKKSNIVRF